MLHNKTSIKRFAIQHAKLLSQMRANFVDISGLQITCDICALLARYLYSMRLSWIIMHLLSINSVQYFIVSVYVFDC